MTDIVERLRDWIPEREIENHWTIDFDALDEQREDAANVIERLRKLMSDVLSYVPHGVVPPTIYDQAVAASEGK